MVALDWILIVEKFKLFGALLLVNILSVMLIELEICVLLK